MTPPWKSNTSINKVALRMAEKFIPGGMTSKEYWLAKSYWVVSKLTVLLLGVIYLP